MKNYITNNLNSQLRNHYEGGDGLAIMYNNPFSEIEDGMDQPKG